MRKPMARGLRVEPFGLAYYEKHVGPWWRPVPLDKKWIVPHPKHEWASGSPDAYDSPTPKTVIELKTQADPWARKLWGTPGTDQMATRFLYQATWLLSVSGAERCVVVCIFGSDTKDDEGNEEFVITEPALYVVDRDASVESHLLQLGERFIEDFVRTGTPPPVKPASNRREFKARLANECGSDAVRRWEARCLEYAAQLGEKAGGSDGARVESAQERT